MHVGREMEIAVAETAMQTRLFDAGPDKRCRRYEMGNGDDVGKQAGDNAGKRDRGEIPRTEGGPQRMRDEQNVHIIRGVVRKTGLCKVVPFSTRAERVRPSRPHGGS
jgi:hypothetical protein